MLILDSDHLRVLRIPGPASDRLANRLVSDGRTVATSIINVHEGINGYLALINRASTALAKVDSYANLRLLLYYFASWDIRPFDAVAASQLESLRSVCECRRINTMDLQIAAVALCNDALLLSANRQHFDVVPGLKVDNWLLDPPLDRSPAT